jgi:hypothetical protein
LAEVAHVQVTVPLAATVSTAGLDDPFRPLVKKMSPTVTDPVAGVVPLPLGGVAGGVVGAVGVEVLVPLSLQPANRLVASMALAISIVM